MRNVLQSACGKEVRRRYRLNVQIRVPIFIALAVLAVGLSLLDIFFFPHERDSVTFVALALTAVATIGGTFYLGETLRAQADLPTAQAVQQESRDEADKAERRKKESFALIARWNSPELFHARKATARALQIFQDAASSGTGEKSVREFLDKSEDIAHNARHVLNFFEELALSVKLGQSDDEILAEAFAGLVLRSFRTYRAWIQEKPGCYWAPENVDRDARLSR